MQCKLLKNVEQFKIDYELLTIKELCEKHSIKNHKTIWRYAKTLSINRPKGSKRKYQVDDSFFSKVENPNMYYILGLIYTDGNLPKGNLNSFIISNIDKALLEEIKREINYTGSITTEVHNKHNKTIYKLQITSEQIRKDLEKFGLTPNKTFTVEFPNIPKEYMRDFVRGLWDGDGSVSAPLSKQKTKLLLKCSFVSANYEFINQLLKVLPVTKKENIHTRIRKNALYDICFRGFDSLRIKDFMYYDNCLCMKRKKDLFFSYLPRRSENTIGNPTNED